MSVAGETMGLSTSVDRKRNVLTTSSTALAWIGPAGVGSFNARLWRVNPNGTQLVEGGTNGPFFLVRLGNREFPIHLESLDSEFVLDGLLLSLALLSEDEQLLGLLRATHNVSGPWGEDVVVPFWELAPEVTQQIARRLSQTCRIGLVILEENSLVKPEIIERLRSLGLDVTSFEPAEQMIED